MNTRIRKAKIEDLGFLQEISRRTIKNSYPSFLGEEAVYSYINSGLPNLYMQENINDCSVLLLNENIVGFSVCKNNLIDLMMIDCNFHRKGLGTILLQYMEQELFKGYDELELESFENNNQANEFYKHNDWVESIRIQDSGINKIVLRKKR